MSASVTFGSVGDIITLCIIIRDLVKALDDSRGSSAEYQKVIRELWALDRVLLEVELLWRTCESTIELDALRGTAHRMADQCRQSIEAFLKKVKKYGPSLRDGGSGSIVRDATMKIRWQVAHTDELTKFRAEINAHCSAINMLLLTASVNLNKLSDQRLHARLALSEGRMESSSKEQQLLLEDVKDKLEENNKQIRAGNAVTLKISEALRLDWVRQLGNELKTFMRKIFVMNVATYKAIMDIRRCLPSHLERSLHQEPFILEDAIGRIAPVHMQFINSWEAFDSVLELRFHNMQGYKMVQNKEYVIQESATRREIGRSNPWEASFLPGQKVVMSMLFNDSTSSTSSCPSCKMSSDEPQNSDVQCAGCGMWYRRITEYNDVDPPPPVSQMSLRKPREEVVVFGQTSFSKVIFGPELPVHLSTSKKRKREDVQNDDITLFKRVRVLSKKTRVRRIKQISGPFTGLATARNGFTGTSTSTAYENIILKSGSNMPNPQSKLPFEKKNFVQSIAASSPPTFLNTIAVPRTDYTACGDDSDDDGDESDGNGDDSDDNGDDNDDGRDDIGDDSPLTFRPQPPPDESESLDPQNDSTFEEDTRAHTPSQSIDIRPPSQPPKERQLHEAISRDVSHEVLRLLDSGIDVEYHWETTPLCRAVEIGNEVIVGTLLVRGANVNKGDVAGWTGLMRAAERGDTELVTLLLSHEADTEMKNIYGNSALQTAAAKGHLSVVRILLDNGSNLLTNALAGQTELQLAAANGHVEVVRLLLERGADGSVKDAHGLTLLHKAATRKHEAVFQLLMQRGADVEVKDDFGRTPLMLYDPMFKDEQMMRMGTTS